MFLFSEEVISISSIVILKVRKIWKLEFFIEQFFCLHRSKTSLILQNEKKFRIFENKLLSKIYGPKINEETREWKKLHNEELHAIYASPDIVRIIKAGRLQWAGYVAQIKDTRNAYRILVDKSNGKRLFGRSKRRWEDNIIVDFKETGRVDQNCIDLAQDSDKWRPHIVAAINFRSKW